MEPGSQTRQEEQGEQNIFFSFMKQNFLEIPPRWEISPKVGK